MISAVQQQLLRLLASGDIQSGTELGTALGISRAAVWKQIQALQAIGIDIQSEQRSGYCLPLSVELLDTEQIRSSLAQQISARIPRLEQTWSCDSTNSELIKRLHQKDAAPGTLLLTEHQSGGRGRRGRQWISPFGGGLYLSLLWGFRGGILSLSGLSLVIGIALAKSIQQLGIDQVKIKWPNDIYINKRKLGGILIELEGESEGPTQVVVGIGINLAIPADTGVRIDQPWCALSEYLDPPLNRNDIIPQLINQLVPTLDRFEQDGLAAFLSEWKQFDISYNRSIEIHQDQHVISGIARGIDQSGALLLEQNGTISPHHSGDLSLRIQQH